MSPRWELSGIPYTSAALPGGIARAIDALRAGGLARRLQTLGVEDAGDLQLPQPTGIRGGSGLLNEEPLAALVKKTHERVGAALERGCRPLLVGGDCPVLLGAMAALDGDHENPGLVMIDGHEDAWPPRDSETGEASDSEIAIALGRVSGLPEPLAGLTPLISSSALAFFGPRDLAEIEEAGVESVRDQVAYFADDEHVGASHEAPGRLMAAAVETIAADGFWLHVDLDALSTAAFAAVDYPQRGGLDWLTVDGLSAAAVNDRRCRGVSVVIYNPDLDPSGHDCRQLINYLCRLVAAC